MKRNWFELCMVVLCILLIVLQVGALCGYWYNEGSVLGLIAAILLLAGSVVRYISNRDAAKAKPLLK